MRRVVLVFLSSAIFLIAISIPVSASIPHLIRYQGYLTDAEGVALEGSYNLGFKIYNSAAGGTPLWSEAQAGVQVSGGNFTVLLGQVAPLDLPFDGDYWLSIEVNNDGEMSPRQRITSVPYAYRANEAEKLGGTQIQELVNVSGDQTVTGNKTFSGNTNFIGAMQQSGTNSILLPSGAVFFMLTGNCPSGTTDVTATYSDKFIRINATQTSTGGADTHDHGGTTGNHTLTVAEMPSHTHDLRGMATAGETPRTMYNDTMPGGSEPSWTGNSDNTTALGKVIATSTGGDSGHSHPISSANNVPSYVACKLCQVD